MKNFSIRLEAESREGIEKIAALEKLKESEVLRRAVRHYLKAMARRKAK